MAGTRSSLRKSRDTSSATKSARGSQHSQQFDGVPDVFQELLSESQTATAGDDVDAPRPLKKRRTGRAPRQDEDVEVHQALNEVDESALISDAPSSPDLATIAHVPGKVTAQTVSRPTVTPTPEKPVNPRILQTIIDSDESEDEDDEDMEWEDALGGEEDSEDDVAVEKKEPQVGDITIKFGEDKDVQQPKRKVRRRAITSVDRSRRLAIHKMHVLCLLHHVHRRNAWCNDRRVQSTLKKLVTSKALSFLIPDPNITQYSASKRFVDGMNELKALWSKRFRITAQGLYKPRWADADAEVRPFSDFDDLDDPMDKDDFRNAAHTLQGSQDVGVQLFCALLRGIGIETRLVCSLQPLPFASAAEKATPQKPSAQKKTIVIDSHIRPTETTPTKPRPHASPRPKKLSRLERVMGERHAVLNKTGVAQKRQKAYHTPYPVYWVEAFNSAHQKWVPIDTHSTFTVNAAEKLEPPLSFGNNILAYAVAFEDDYTAKDVTRRYAKAYNAKTRKFRVECTPDGERWWRKAMKFFKRPSTLDRDQVEDATLGRKEAAEGIPKNVQDFKGHPVYVLERHLKHNEVIHPLHQVGKVNCGTSMNPKMEPIFRRTNVHTVRSSDKWYRMGRDVLSGEQPLKHAKPKRVARDISVGIDAEEVAEEAGAGLYAEFQTELYVPPPVVRGRVPRNAYGNLDLYVPSMCPPGGTHIRHKLASKAARIVGVDYADAVTGFSFKGRHGTAIAQGVVVASQYAEAVQAVIDGFEYQQEAAAIEARRNEALRLWRRFYLGLKIVVRIKGYPTGETDDATGDVQGEIDREDRELRGAEMAGGFLPDEAEPDIQPSIAPYQNNHHQEVEEDNEDIDTGGGFIAEEPDSWGAATSLTRQQSFESSILDSQQLRPQRKRSFGEVYSSAEEDDFAGGFILEDAQAAAGPSSAADLQREPEATTAPVDADAVEVQPAAESPPKAVEKELSPEVAAPDKDEDVTMRTPTSSPSEVGSLPLEDPEDEDADPDWLVDAT